MLKLAEKALSEDRLLNAAFYYRADRAAEFYTFSNDPDKELLYDKFIHLFYSVFENDDIETFEAPYDEAYLPGIKIPSMNDRNQIED